MTAKRAYSRLLTPPPFTITSVVNTNVSSLPSAVAVAPPSAALTYLGARTSDLVNVQGSGGYGNKWKNGGSAAYSTAPWGAQFRAINTRFVEFMVAPVGTDASCRVYVDGAWNQAVPLTFPNFAQNVFNTFKVDLGPLALRSAIPVVRIELSANMLLAQVWVESTGNIAPAPNRGKRVVAHGDSLTQGETQNTGGELGSYVGYLGKYLQTADIWNSGIRGSGPSTSSTNGGNYMTRMTTDVANTNADMVLISGWFNDRSAGRTPALVAADMGTAVDTALAMRSRPQVIVFGSPDPTGGSNATEWATYDSAVQTAMQARGVPYVSMSTGRITMGNGAVIETQGPWVTPAILGWFRGSDGLHPTNAGHEYLASRYGDAINAIQKYEESQQTVERNEFITAATNYTITLPLDSSTPLMKMVEVRATAAITVSVPASVKMTGGVASGSVSVPSGKSAFIGLRYSPFSRAWYLLSATVEV